MKSETPRISQLSQLGDLLKTKQFDSLLASETDSATSPSSQAADQPASVIYLGYSGANELGDNLQ
jgi:hypothetical protein